MRAAPREALRGRLVLMRPDPPHDLCLPAPRSTTGRAVLTLATRGLYETWRTLEPPPGVHPAAIAAFDTARSVVLQLFPGNPKAAARLFRGPTCGTPLRRIRDRRPPVDDALVEAAGQLLFGLAITGELPAEAALETLSPRLVSVEARRVVALGPRVRTVRFARGRLLVDGASVDLARPEPSPELAFVSLHSVVSRVHGDAVVTGAGAPPLAEAARRLREALQRVEAVLPSLRAEMDLFLPVIVPSYAPPDPTAIGVGRVPIDLGPTALDLALIRTHTEQKMHAFLELDPLVAHDAPLLVEAATRVPALAYLEARADVASLDAERAALVAALTRLRACEPTLCGTAVLDEMGRALAAKGPSS